MHGYVSGLASKRHSEALRVSLTLSLDLSLSGSTVRQRL